MRPIATDTYNFERLMTDGYTYVDKTAVLYPLINKTIGSQFFLSRPRRFGKSLLVSTFKSLFQGRRDLFYAGKYAMSGKRITLIGISFSAEKRTIVEDLVEEL